MRTFIAFLTTAIVVELCVGTAVVNAESLERKEFLAFAESRIIDHVLYKGTLFIDHEQFKKHAVEPINFIEDAADTAILHVERNGNTAYLVSTETLYIISNQSFDPTDLSELGSFQQ